MAKLNDPPAPIESIEVVKRRFLRQNREFAKCNSNQSIRIRTLEADVSRLLAENLELREQVLQLQAEVESYEHRPPAESVTSTKNLLEAKIQELGELVAGLDELRKPATKCKPQAMATKKSPDERNWRNALLLSDAMGGEGMLPVIAEDKYYPRRTLDAQEIDEIVAEGHMDSPDLGPPPIAHFQDEDPIKCDLATQSQEADAIDATILENIPAVFSANLETRRKRRESQTKPERRRVSMFEASPDRNDAGSSSETNENPRIGSKRKLSTRDDEGNIIANETSSTADFSFSRKQNQEPRVSSSRKEALNSTTTATAARKILGAKTTNSLSPKKKNRLASDSAKVAANEPVKELKQMRKGDENPRPINVDIPPPPAEDVVETFEMPLDNVKLPPKTPAGLGDILSPTSTEIATTRTEIRDTPPPGELGGTSIDQQLAGRGSRRRVPVSYAEPKLNVKMRRPGKELTDAVAKGPSTSATSLKSEEVPSAPATIERSNMRTVVIKRELGLDDANWRGLPQTAPEQRSPLSNKTSAAPSDFAASEAKKSEQTKVTGSGAAISALLSGSSSTKPKGVSKSTQYVPDKDLDRHKDSEDADMAIFDFNESSPTSESTSLPKDRAELARERTAARRHSSISALSSKNSESSVKSATSKRLGSTDNKVTKSVSHSSDSKISSHGGARGDRAASRRRSMML